MSVEHAPRTGAHIASNTFESPRGQLHHLGETLNLIDAALEADDFYHQDRQEIIQNREYFARRYEAIARHLGRASVEAL